MASATAPTTIESPPVGTPAAGETSPLVAVPSVPGIIVMDDRGARLQRRAVLVLTILPFAGLIAAIATLWGRGLSVTDLGIFLGMYFFAGFGVTVGYHRFFTHRSFDAPRPVKILLAIAGSMAVEGSVISWVATHRRHHAYSDKEGDPHSPHLDEGEGMRGVVRGLFHAHMGWLFDPEETSADRWAPDLVKDPDMRRINSLFPLWVTLAFVIPALLGLVLTQSLYGALTAVLWGGLVRMLLLHHVTWSINSICHFYGKRPFRTTDYSTNNWMLSVISMGESWHNNHHAFPSAAIHGIGKWQIDTTGLFIKGLRKLGMARNVKTVSSKQIESKTF